MSSESAHGRRNVRTDNSEAYRAYVAAMLERMRRDYERKREEEEERERARLATSSIQVDTAVLYPKDNAKSHHTDMYELLNGKEPSLILRRGQPFYLAVRFKREFNPDSDRVHLEFSLGATPQMSKGTLVSLDVPEAKGEFKRGSDQWDIRMSHHDRAIVTLQVHIPPSVSVGVWKLVVHSEPKANPGPVWRSTYKIKENIYILFNPWCKDDVVYMENDTWRKEYVLEDTGKIFMGSYKQPRGRQWIYGQFADVVLPACMFILEKSKLTDAARANPVKVVRAVSAVVNSVDENGILTGNWSGNYEGGTAPWMWTGSTAIFEQYMKGAGKPVDYGQCWVFAGVANTVCRALGIPSRPVTNYASAHDTDESLTIDKYFDQDGKELKDYAQDSIWNFHVWNEVWMARLDLPVGYGGWQAIDATPQETSDGIYQVGPCSVVAVKKGEVGYMYDSPFVFSEVNADIVHWKQNQDSAYGWDKYHTKTYYVGQGILTKKVGVRDSRGVKDAEDITDHYKNKEGTEEERMSVLNAARSGGLRFIFDMPHATEEDVSLKLQDIDAIMIGEPFDVTVTMENKSSQRRTVSAVLSASAVYYTGILARTIKREKEKFVLQPHQKEVLSIHVSVDDYLDKLVDFAMVKIYVIANVLETKQAWSEQDDFAVEKPTMKLKVDQVRVGKEFTLSMSFYNPLKKALTDCSVSIEGPGLASPHTVNLQDVEPKAKWQHAEKFVPKRAGNRNIVAIFNCREIFDVQGSLEVTVLE